MALLEVIGLQRGEDVLILTDLDTDSMRIAEALFREARIAGGRPVIAVQETQTPFSFAERLVLEAIRAGPDVIFTLSAGLSGNDPYGTYIGYVGRDHRWYDHPIFQLTDGDRRMRGAICEGATVDMFRRCVAVDYDRLRATAARLLRALDGGRDVRITTPAGTDLTLSIRGRKASAEDGNFRNPGEWGDLPAGEVRVSPEVGSARGTVVFDGTIDLEVSSIVPDIPVIARLEDGYIAELTGGEEADALLQIITRAERMALELNLPEYAKNARHLGELGLGINYAAKLTGNLLEDEKVLGTVHLAIGYNYDNDANAFIHQDCVLLKPSLWVDGRQVLGDGQLLDTL